MLPLIQQHATAPGKVAEEGPGVWTLAAHVGNQGEFLGSWFLPGLAPAAVSFGVVISRWDRSHCLSFCL